ncbi:hypothetical protein ACVWW9_001202 [Agrococcus sp. UYP33]
MTYAPPPAPRYAPPPAPGPGTVVAGIIAIAAPIVAVLVKLPSSGWLMVFFFISGLLWLAGYALLIVAVSLGMLRRRGQLRFGARRVRAIIWALLTSVGIVVLGFTVIDGGDTTESVQSTLTLMLGAPVSPSPAHSLTEAISWIAAVAWIVGWAALVVEWIVAASRSRRAVTSVAPPVLPPRLG